MQQPMQNLGQGGPPLASYIHMQQRQIPNNMQSPGMMGPPSFPSQGTGPFSMPPAAALQYQMQQNGISQAQQQQMMMQMQAQAQAQQQQQQQQQQHQQSPVSQQQQMQQMLMQQRQMLQHQQQQAIAQAQQQQAQHQIQQQQGMPQQSHLGMQQSMQHLQNMGQLGQQMPLQPSYNSPSMKKKPRPMPAMSRPSQMAPPPPAMRAPMLPIGPQSGELEPYADEFDSTLPQDLAIARFEMRHNALNEIFSPERLSQLPEPDDGWTEKPLDELEAELAAMEEANEKLVYRSETELDELQLRLDKAGKGEELTPVSSPSP